MVFSHTPGALPPDDTTPGQRQRGDGADTAVAVGERQRAAMLKGDLLGAGQA